MKKIITLMILSSLVLLTSCGETNKVTTGTGTNTEISENTNTWATDEATNTNTWATDEATDTNTWTTDEANEEEVN